MTKRSRLPKRNYALVDRRVLKSLGRDFMVKEMISDDPTVHKTRGEALGRKQELKRQGEDVVMVKFR